MRSILFAFITIEITMNAWDCSNIGKAYADPEGIVRIFQKKKKKESGNIADNEERSKKLDSSFDESVFIRNPSLEIKESIQNSSSNLKNKNKNANSEKNIKFEKPLVTNIINTPVFQLEKSKQVSESQKIETSSKNNQSMPLQNNLKSSVYNKESQPAILKIPDDAQFASIKDINKIESANLDISKGRKLENKLKNNNERSVRLFSSSISDVGHNISKSKKLNFQPRKRFNSINHTIPDNKQLLGKISHGIEQKSKPSENNIKGDRNKKEHLVSFGASKLKGLSADKPEKSNKSHKSSKSSGGSSSKSVSKSSKSGSKSSKK